MTKFNKIKVVILISTFCFLFSSVCHAATLSLEPTNSSYGQGESFIEEIRVDNQGENLNAFEIDLKYSAEFLEVTDVNFGDSILNFIVDQPSINQKDGTIHFSGIVPGGYNGRVPGDPGAGNLVAKIIFKIKKQENLLVTTTAEINFTNKTKILLNDGKATVVTLNEKGTKIEILDQVVNEKNDVLLEEDRIPPEIFKPEINHSPEIFDNQWFVVFSTQDKISGIDHYEIQESRMDQPLLTGWLKVESPYLLKDQSLKNYIFVKAIDKNGNKQIVRLEPKSSLWSNQEYSKYGIMILLILVVLIIIYLIPKMIIKVKDKKF